MYTSQPDVQVAEDNCEWGGAVEGSRVGVGRTWLVVGGSPFLSLMSALSAAVKLSCTYSGFSSPRVEWKFVQGDTTTLVCYNSQITGKLIVPVAKIAELLALPGLDSRGGGGVRLELEALSTSL